MKVAYLLDEQISPRVAEQLRSAGIEARAVCGCAQAGQDDQSIFRAAVKEGRIMVTYNIADLSAVYGDLVKEGAQVPGLVFVNTETIDNADIQGLVRALTKLAKRLQAGEVDASAGLFLS